MKTYLDRLEKAIVRETKEFDVIHNRLVIKSHALLEWVDFIKRGLGK